MFYTAMGIFFWIGGSEVGSLSTSSCIFHVSTNQDHFVTLWLHYFQHDPHEVHS